MTADLIIGNNVLAQVPNLKEFVKSMKIILKPLGVINMEFPHLMKLIDEKPVRHNLSRTFLILFFYNS